MPTQETIKKNADKGYIYVGGIDGDDIWKRFDGISTVYYLDEGFEEVLPIWNTTRSKEILKLIFNDQQ